MGTRSLTSIVVKFTVTASVKNKLTDSVEVTAAQGVTLSQARTSGVSANQADRAWQRKEVALSSGAAATIGLADVTGIDIGAGAGLDATGQTWDAEEIMTLVIHNESTSTGSLGIEPGASEAITWMPTLAAANGGSLKPGGTFIIDSPNTAGLAISASTDRLKLTANSGDLVYSIYVLARHDTDESSSSSSQSSSSSSSQSSSSSSSSSLSSSST